MSPMHIMSYTLHTYNVLYFTCNIVHTHSTIHSYTGQYQLYRAINNYTELYTAKQSYTKLYTTIQSYTQLYRDIHS